MVKTSKQSPKDASNVFHNIVKASVKRNPNPAPKEEDDKKK